MSIIEAMAVSLNLNHYLENSRIACCHNREYSRERDVRVMRKNNKVKSINASTSSYTFPYLEYNQSSVWGNHFLSYTCQLTEITSQEKHEVEELKEKVRKMLVDANSREKLVLIDTIQRLGVAYHFNDEIETSIKNIFDEESCENDDNLCVVSLRFRLTRQQGHYMSSDVFKRFTNHDGTFKEDVNEDVEGLLSLYEAAYMRVHNERILEEALTFTTTHLELMLPTLNDSLKVQVIEALSQPIRKTVPRVGAWKSIHIYGNTEGHNHLLLKFSKLDFNILQKMHQRELKELTRWWKALDRAKKFPYARDRLVECYMWILGFYFEPQYSLARNFLTKVMVMSTVLDDTYDNYASYDELVLFTDAVQRWEVGAVDSLQRPYLRNAYEALLDIYSNMEEELRKEGESDRVYYAIYEMKKLARAYIKEAKWLNDGNTPKCEEYVENGIVSCAGMVLTTSSLVGMGEFINKETFEWMINEPLVVRASSAITRLMDDLDEHEVESGASFIKCYMKEYGSSKQEAEEECLKRVSNAWKDINQELLHPRRKAPMFVLERLLNEAKLMDTFFLDEDGYTNPKNKFKDIITSLLVDSIYVV